MSGSRKFDPDQLNLSQSERVLSKTEDKNLVRLVTHRDVAAYCAASDKPPIKASEWANCQEVLTYMIEVRGSNGIFPSVETMAGKTEGKKGAFNPRVVSERTVERALQILRYLGVIWSSRWGKQPNRYDIHFDRLAEIRSAGMTAMATVQAASIRQFAAVDPQSCRIEPPGIADRTTDNFGSTIRGFNLEPAISQPTTTYSDVGSNGDGPDEWGAVVDEIFKLNCGVKQPAPAVAQARQCGARPDDVRAIVAYWHEHKAGWQEYPVENLIYRLKHFVPGQSLCDGWPSFDKSYQAQLDRDRVAQQRVVDGKRQLRERDEWQHEKARCQAEQAKLYASGFTLVGELQKRLLDAALDSAPQPRPP